MFWMEKWWSPWSWISIESKKCVGKHDSQMHFVCTFMCEIKICGRKICIEIFGIDEWKLGKTCSLLEPEGRGNKKKWDPFFSLYRYHQNIFGQNSHAQFGYSLLTKIYPTCTTLKHYQLNADKTDSLAQSHIYIKLWSGGT